MARGEAACGRGIPAHGILRRNLSCSGSQLSNRQLFWSISLARNVCGGRVARAVAGLGAVRRDRTGALETKRKCRALLENLAALFGAFFKGALPPDDPEFAVHAGVDLRIVGRNSLRARGSNHPGGGGRKDWPAGRAAAVARSAVG